MSRAELIEFAASGRSPSGGRSFEALRSVHDTLVVWLFLNKSLQRVVQDQTKTNLESLWDETVRKLSDKDKRHASRVLEPLRPPKYREGLRARLFVASAMAFDSMHEALHSSMSAPEAKQRLGERLLKCSEIALRIAACSHCTRNIWLGDAARRIPAYPNFALDGAVPRDLPRLRMSSSRLASSQPAEGGRVKVSRPRLARCGTATFDPSNTGS